MAKNNTHKNRKPANLNNYLLNFQLIEKILNEF